MSSAKEANSRHPTKRRKFDFGEGSTVTVLVGSEQQKFIVHRDALAKSSTFFASAVKPEWMNLEDRQIQLPDQDVTAFEIYINWLYSGSTDLWKDDEVIMTHKNKKGETLESRGPRYRRIIRCYVLGDYVNDSEFCDALIDAYFDVQNATKNWPANGDCDLAFEKLGESSKLRLLLVHHIAFSSSSNSFSRRVSDGLNSELVKEIALTSVADNKKTKKKITERGRCFYHLHGDGSNCASP